MEKVKEYKHIFFDLDHTLWDFEKNSKETLFELYDRFNLQAVGGFSKDRFYEKYKDVNAAMWNQYNVGEIDQKVIPVQLLIDSGGTDSLWLFEDEEKGIITPDNAFEDFIGEGISGGIFGKRSRIEAFRLKKFEI